MADLPEPRRQPEPRLKASLHYIGLQTPQPAQLSRFYGEMLGYDMARRDDLLVGVGPDRRIILAAGAARTLHEVGYALASADELAALRERLDAAHWPRVDTPTAFFTDAVRLRDPDANPLAFGLPHDQTPGPATHAPPARLQHVVVASRDPDRIVRFFADTLGFVLSDNVVDPQGAVRTSFLRCSREHHSFAVFKAAHSGLDHHCYETTDWNSIRDWCDHLAEANIELKWGPGRHGPGNNLFVFVHDPDGNWVEFSAELEIVDQDRLAGVWPHDQRTLNRWGQGLLRS